MSLALGAIADDFTGATDLASMLARGGLRTELVLGRPGPDTPPSGADAVVVALKSRTAPVAEAITDSVESWRWCAAAGATRCYFKYCSTFDSTAGGNIGPVAEALMVATGATRTVYTPAFPENGRSIYMGKLFVGQMLLSESGMRNHPLTPMTDADLPRTLAPQLSEGARTGLVPWPTVRAGAAAVAAELDRLASAGIAHVVVDALDQSDLNALAEAVRDWPLVTAGSGLGLSLGRLLGTSAESEALPAVGGPALLLSGSCSDATNGQVARWKADGGALMELDPLGPSDQAQTAAEAAATADRPLLISSTAPPDKVAAAQAALGRAEAAARMEAAVAGAAVAARAAGVRRFIVAGGETSGAVASALGVARLAVGPSIAPGVPWCTSLGEDPVALALKSGNFGAETFFADALASAP
ncbi:MAG: 3-oxo-tetronate kinase [Pseudomonadota bacterium]